MHIHPRIKIQTNTTHIQKQPILLSLLVIILTALALALFSGCSSSQKEKKKLKDVDYTILEERDIPEKLAESIEQKKEAEFKLSFETESDLYLVHGYGEQETGGYSIVVRDLFLTEILNCSALKTVLTRKRSRVIHI